MRNTHWATLVHERSCYETGVSVNTIQRWVSLLEGSGIIALAFRYYRNLGSVR
jgi:hypothetical protein